MHPNKFSPATKAQALERQRNQCAACGEPISALGEDGAEGHEYGESAQAHHMLHIKRGGTADVSNCVVLDQSCHYSVHEGGNYRFGTEMSTASAYSFFDG